MNHQVNYDDIKDFLLSHDLAFSVGKGNNKHLSLEITARSIYYNFVVTNNKIQVYKGRSLKRAIEIYNAY